MKKGLYFLCVCALSMVIGSEFQKNNEPSDSVETGRFATEKPETKKTAYLTFDDGPSEVTPGILDTLKQKNVKATFFLVGSEITPERESIVKRELEEGHSIGVHTFSHKRNEMYCNKQKFFEDFNMCFDRIKEVTGISPTLHRFPWGSNNSYVCPIVDDLIQGIQAKKVKSFDWNVSGEDSVGRNVPKAVIYRNIAKDLEKHDQPIILLHDSNTMKNTAAVLGEVIDLVADKGYSFATLDEREEYVFDPGWRK